MTSSNVDPTPSPLARVLGAVRTVDSTAGVIVDNWISVPAWYVLIKAIGLTPGKPLHRLARREFDASR
ncbi:hypothetical protein HQ314_20490 [Rhodococcus sp. BP-332]|uniref:hypothetical protein n=1 Tax=Rhodococcus sp. BP-332 TaxID=2739447 RepID=UPI001C9B4C3E|nr:hypothetical protein [Rhodococcus sp. BP-332]MBY6679299.1 hypothetical protein [Rhodococcus sp. BP-332]